MKLVTCPHCKSHRIVTRRVPKDVLVVMPCQSCAEWVLLFREKVIALDRRVLEEGSFEERKEHVAAILAEFLEPGMFDLFLRGDGMAMDVARESDDEAVSAEGEEGGVDDDLSEIPISDKEVAEFAKYQLRMLDDPRYFKRHFGS